MKNNKQYDAIIIGAGASGLMAAAELSRARKSVLILEARPRVGGRIFTAGMERGFPIELGAEFIHELSEDIEEIFAESSTAVLDAEGEHLYRKGRVLKPLAEEFEGITSALDKLHVPKGKDVSMASLLPKHPRTLMEKFAYKFVEGFNAASASELSARALLRSHREANKEGGYKTYRPSGGYRKLIDVLLARLDTRRVDLRADSQVVAIDWERRKARVTTKSGARFQARTVLITVPPPILAKRISFSPDIPKTRAAAADIGMGNAVRVTVKLSLPLEKISPLLDEARFIHLPEEHFPTWWTSRPVRAPILVAWSGGPAADRLSNLSKTAFRSALITSLGKVLGMSAAKAKSKVESVWFHNWKRDQFSLGAYSFIRVGKEDAPQQTGRSIQGTLFFAGEAITSETIGGTVSCAVESGKRAAKSMVDALSARR